MRAVNLLPADLRGAVKAPVPVTPAVEDSGGSGAYFALGALALCVLALAGYVLTTNTIKQRESDLAALEARSLVVMAESARLKPYADFASMAQARVATVNDLASQRFDWEGSFRDLARALPEDVSVKSLTGSISTESGGGNALRSAINVPAIELEGCTSDQASVARMMARLRAVDGVTRVSLANAVKTGSGDSGGAPAADFAAASGATLTGCAGKGKSDPSDFQVVVFFENAAAASAAPSTPAPPPAAPAGAPAPADGSAPAPADGSAPAPEDGSAPAPTATPGAEQPPASTDAASGTSVPTSTENE